MAHMSDSNYKSNIDYRSGYDSTQPREQAPQLRQEYFKLPADNLSKVLAILATILTTLCCCFGGEYLATVLATIGFISAHNSIKKYQETPLKYDPVSYKKVRNARVFNLVVGIFALLYSMLTLLYYFKLLEFAQEIEDEIEKYRMYSPGNDNDLYEEEITDDWYYYEETDSTDVDIIEQEESVEPIDTTTKPYKFIDDPDNPS